MQRKIFTLACLSLIFAGLAAQENNVVDTWLNADETAHIRIFKATNGSYYGKIEWLKNDPDKLDVNNPDVEKKKNPVLGLMILRDFIYDAEKKQWSGGTIYDPDNGKTYDCFMWFDNDPDVLSIKGYVLGMKFIGRETKWKRVTQS